MQKIRDGQCENDVILITAEQFQWLERFDEQDKTTDYPERLSSIHF